MFFQSTQAAQAAQNVAVTTDNYSGKNHLNSQRVNVSCQRFYRKLTVLVSLASSTAYASTSCNSFSVATND